MQAWKQALWLAKFELREAAKGFFLGQIFFFTVFALFTIVMLEDYMQKGFAGFDLLFLLMFIFGPSWVVPKDFQFQRINGSLDAAPISILLLHLPLTKKAIIKSRIIVYFAYSFPFQLIALLSIYAFNPEVQAMLSPASYVAFSIFWLSFGIFAGYSVLITEIGTEVKEVWRKMQIIFILLFFIAILFLLAFFQLLFKHGLVHWTLMIAANYPIGTIGISVLLAVFGLIFWMRKMERQMEKTDYL